MPFAGVQRVARVERSGKLAIWSVSSSVCACLEVNKLTRGSTNCSAMLMALERRPCAQRESSALGLYVWYRCDKLS